MATPAVLFHLWPGNAGVVAAALRRLPGHALVTREATLKTQELSNQAGRCSLLGDLLLPEHLAAVETAVQAGLEAAADLFAGKDWESLCARYGFDPLDMRRALRRDLTDEWRRQIFLIESLERAATRYALGAVVLNEEYSAESKALVKWAVRRGIPVLHVFHGMAMEGIYNRAADLEADMVSGFGPRHAESLQDLGLLSGRIADTGNPAWSRFSQLAGMKDKCREALAKLMKWGHGPLFVFGTTLSPFNAATARPGSLSRAARAFFRSGRKLSASHPDAIWVVLLRPTDPPGLEADMKGWAKAEGLHTGSVHCFRSDSELFLAAAQAVVSIDSCLSVEALLAGTPAINLYSDAGWRMGPAFAAGTGVEEVSEDGLDDALGRAMSGSGLDTRLREEAVSVYHPPRGRDPAEKVVDWVESRVRALI